jgi:hypothetical protein
MTDQTTALQTHFRESKRRNMMCGFVLGWLAASVLWGIPILIRTMP